MLNKLFGGSEKENFFLDLNDNSDSATPTPAVSAPTSIAAPEPIAPTPVAADPAPVVMASIAPEVPETPEAPEVSVEAPAPLSVIPESAPTAAPEPASVNFATTYLRSSGSGAPRRRPSANMSGFMDMARGVRG